MHTKQTNTMGNIFIEAVLGFLALVIVLLLAFLIYAGINQATGKNFITEDHGVVIDKKEYTTTTNVLVGKVMVPQIHHHHYIIVEYKGRHIKIDDGSTVFNAVKINDTVLLGYYVGGLDEKRHYNHVYKVN